MLGAGYIRIKPQYQLRGWLDIPYAVLNRDTSAVLRLTEDAFRTARLCNGCFTAESPLFMGVRQLHLEALDRAGVLEWLPEQGSLEPEQEYQRFDNCRVTSVQWAVTGRCNYRCRHCYMSAPHAALPQLGTEECLDIVDQMAACGILRLTITGGEPLVRPDFLQIVDRIQENGMRIDVLMTNGSLLTGELLDELASRGCHPEICLSYDGTQGWHDWMRGVQDAEDNFTRAMRLCREHGFVTCVETVLHAGNKHLLRDTVAHLGSLGASSVKVLPLSCAGEARSIAQYALTADEFYEACLAYAPQYVEDGIPVPILSLGPLKVSEGRPSIPLERNDCSADCRQMAICGSGRRMMYLGPDGRILPCTPIAELDAEQTLFPLIGSAGLKQALTESSFTSFVTTTLEEYLQHNRRCADCAYKNPCGAGCRAKAMRENGGTDLLGVDEETCAFFKGGCYERAKRLVEELREPAARAWDLRESRAVQAKLSPAAQDGGI